MKKPSLVILNLVDGANEMLQYGQVHTLLGHWCLLQTPPFVFRHIICVGAARNSELDSRRRYVSFIDNFLSKRG